jgi:L-histidine N-alpha-methyltransferase
MTTTDGVTAAFNLNILNRLNKELDADFDLTAFRHRFRWNAVESRIEMHLESLCEQSIRIAAAELDVYFRKGETIHTENSCKFNDGMLGALLSDSGIGIRRLWKDARGWYALTLSHLQGQD